MPQQNGKPPTFLTEASYQAAQARLALLRQKLIDSNAGLLVENPQLADVLNDQVDALEATIEGAADGPDAPADNGLSGLIGLGPSAATNLGQTRIASSVRPYDEQIGAERGQAMADMYHLYQHEALGAIRAVLKLQDLFKAGVVRLADGVGAYRLYQFDRKQVLRYSAQERAQAYMRAFGYRLPGTRGVPLAPYASANRQFHSLFNTFIAETARFFRDKRISEVVRERANDPSFGSIAIVRRAGLDLRYNIQNFSYGHISVLRIEMMQLLEEAFQILGADDVRNLFGADNAWQVIEDVLRRYFQEHLNVSPRSRMAIAGRTILSWLSQPFILAANRTQFEGLAQQIAEPAEEWLSSAQTIGVAIRVPEIPRTYAVPSGRAPFG